MEKFIKREWVAGDTAPGASDLNRIEIGIDFAHNRINEIEGDITNLKGATIQGNTDIAPAFVIDSIEKLENSAKVSDCVAKINEIIDALTAKTDE